MREPDIFEIHVLLVVFHNVMQISPLVLHLDVLLVCVAQERQNEADILVVISMSFVS